MRLTPHLLMRGVRVVGVIAAVGALGALAGPVRYEDLNLPFSDTVAHGLLFYGLGALLLGALPQSRTSDLAWTLAGLGAASEMAQALVGRQMSLHDFAGDLAGATLVILPVYVGRFRALARAHPHATFAELRRADRRRGRSRKPARMDVA